MFVGDVCISCLETVSVAERSEHLEQRHKNVEFPCPTFGCPGDARYVPPGRRHIYGCTGPV